MVAQLQQDLWGEEDECRYPRETERWRGGRSGSWNVGPCVCDVIVSRNVSAPSPPPPTLHHHHRHRSWEHSSAQVVKVELHTWMCARVDIHTIRLMALLRYLITAFSRGTRGNLYTRSWLRVEGRNKTTAGVLWRRADHRPTCGHGGWSHTG